jgi:hypothetical protein
MKVRDTGSELLFENGRYKQTQEMLVFILVKMAGKTGSCISLE